MPTKHQGGQRGESQFHAGGLDSLESDIRAKELAKFEAKLVRQLEKLCSPVSIIGELQVFRARQRLLARFKNSLDDADYCVFFGNRWSAAAKAIAFQRQHRMGFVRMRRRILRVDCDRLVKLLDRRL